MNDRTDNTHTELTETGPTRAGHPPNAGAPATSGPTALATTDDLQAVVVAALTELARQAQPDTHGHRRGPDAAEVIAAVVTTVAANLGGVEVLLAGRPESWEADHIRNLVHAAAGEDVEGLWRWRTAPVRIVLDTEAAFHELGLTRLFLDDCDQLEAMYPDPDVVSDAAGEGRPTGDLGGGPGGGVEAVGGAEVVEGAGRVAEELFDELFDVVNRLFDDDRAAYLAAYAEVVVGEVARLGRPDLPVQVVDGVVSAADRAAWVPMPEQLQLVADERTVLPPTGQPPDWSTGDPAAAVRAAGGGYLDRARARHSGQVSS